MDERKRLFLCLPVEIEKSITLATVYFCVSSGGRQGDPITAQMTVRQHGVGVHQHA
jgi:hypothetical protein